VSEVKARINTEARGAAASAGPGEGTDEVIVDGVGRRLKLRQIGVLDESRLVRMLGSEAAQNVVYVTGYALPAVSVEEIDGVHAPFPSNQAQLDALIQRVGREGIAAVLTHRQAKADESGVDAVKKSVGTHQASGSPAGS
jgi:hypothetical protein